MTQSTQQFRQEDYFHYLHQDSKSYARSKLITIPTQVSDSFFKFEQAVELAPHDGIAEIILTMDTEDESHRYHHILRQAIRIHPGVAFNAVAATPTCSIYLEPFQQAVPSIVKSPILLQAANYRSTFTLQQIYAIDYARLVPEQTMIVEHSRYYEWLMVDHGQIDLQIGELTQSLTQNQAILIPKGSSYAYQLNQAGTMTAYVSIIFDATGLELALDASDSYFQIGAQNRQRVERIISMSQSKSELPYLHDDLNIQFNYLLIKLLQANLTKEKHPVTSMRENYESELFQSMVDFIHDNVETHNEVSQLVEAFALSRSTIQTLFNKHVDMSPKAYINRVRLQRSQELIRDSQLSLSEIADKLGYGSIQYFSRVFSNEFGMSPSAYAKSLH